MPEEVKKGARHRYEVPKKHRDELSRKLEKGRPDRGVPGALEQGWLPDFYAYGEGAFARQFDGMRPMHVAKELEPYFSGDLMEVADMNDSGVQYFSEYFAPFDADFNVKHEEARRKYQIARTEGQVAQGRGGYYGKKFGLKPMTRKRSTPFTVPKDAVVRGIGPEDGGDVDVG